MQEIILIVVVLALVVFMFYNSRKRKRQQETLQNKMVPGVRVMLSFGVYGKLLSVDDEKVTAQVEVAPGTILTVHRQTLSRVVDDDATEVVENPDHAPETIAPAQVAELNGEPIYGERVEDASEVEAAKRKSQD